MSTPAELNTMFNHKLIDFIDDLEGVIGHLPEYPIVVTSVKMLSHIQENKNRQVFDKYICEPYEEYILARDEAFLLNKDYDEVERKLGGQESDASGGGIVSLLKGVWSTLSKENKASIWEHMQVLLFINRRYKQSCSPSM